MLNMVLAEITPYVTISTANPRMIRADSVPGTRMIQKSNLSRARFISRPGPQPCMYNAPVAWFSFRIRAEPVMSRRALMLLVALLVTSTATAAQAKPKIAILGLEVIDDGSMTANTTLRAK